MSQTTPDQPAQPDDAQPEGAPPPPEPGQETLGAPAEPGTDPSLEKDPSDWVTGDDPMTEAQKSYLDTLARQAGEEIRADLTKGEASEQIDRLRRATGQGDAGSTTKTTE